MEFPKAEIKSARSGSPSSDSFKFKTIGTPSSKRIGEKEKRHRRTPKPGKTQQYLSTQTKTATKASFDDSRRVLWNSQADRFMSDVIIEERTTSLKANKTNFFELAMHQAFRIQRPSEKNYRPLKETEERNKTRQQTQRKRTERTSIPSFRAPIINRTQSVKNTALKSSEMQKNMSRETLQAAKNCLFSKKKSSGQINLTTVSAKVQTFWRPTTQARPITKRTVPKIKKEERNQVPTLPIMPVKRPMTNAGQKEMANRNKMATAMGMRHSDLALKLGEFERETQRMKESIRKGILGNVPLMSSKRTTRRKMGTKQCFFSDAHLKSEKEADFEVFDKFSKRNKETGSKLNLEACYNLGKVIGRGAYATVRMIYSKETGEKMAMKTYEKQKLFDETRRKNVRRETEILLRINHPNVIRLNEVFHTETQIHLVMEYFCTQSLSSYLKSKPNQCIEENEAKLLFKQIVDALAFCHSKYVVHRDIKMDNILVNSSGTIKLIDFGFSISADSDQKLTLFCGTPSYMAPEIVMKREYCGPPADTWACGIMLFKMLSGKYPFQGSDEKALYKEIYKCDLKFPECFSEEARDLLSKIIVKEPNQRIKCPSIGEHPWFTTETSSHSLVPFD